MAQYNTELFIQFVYSLELSYHDLLEREEALKAKAAAVLEMNGGAFIHFEGMGDTMRGQCVFEDNSENLFHPICDELCQHMDSEVEARLLFVDKNLDFLHFYSLSMKSWKESCIMPPQGPIAKAILEEQDC